MPEGLLAEREWVHDLARRLVADAGNADDIEQQTWLSALRSPPRHGASLRGWLGTVMRHWLQKAQRGEQRRARRERDAARAEASPSTAEIVAKAEAHRRVVQAVFGLDEPFKTTVILRFYENQSLAEVAARTGVPLQTAKSRVRRALELLRAGFDRDTKGGRPAWLLALAPLTNIGSHAAAHATAGILEALIMSTKQKVVVLAILLLSGAGAYWALNPGVPAPSVTPGAGVDGAAAVSPLAGAANGPGGAGGPEAQRAERTLLAGAAVPVAVEVRTWTGAPIEGAVVEAIEPAANESDHDRPDPQPKAQATTDAAGSVTFTDLPAGRWHFIAKKPGFCRAGKPDVVLFAGVRPDPVVIHLGTGHTLEGTVFAGSGRAVAGAVVTAYPTSSALVRPRTTTDGQGQYRLDALTAGPTYVAAALPGGTVSVVETVQVPEVGHFDLVLRTGGILTGKVTDKQTGGPVAGVLVEARTSQAGSFRSMSASARTDAQGRYAIDTLGEGLIHEVTAAKDGYVQVPDLLADNFDSMIPFRDGGTWTRDLLVSRGGRLVVTVRGPDGPVAGAKVRPRMARDDGRRPPVVTDAGGHGVLAAVVPGRLLLEVTADGLQQPGFPVDWWSVINDPTAANQWLVAVAEGAETPIEIALVRAAAIVGRVVGSDDKGLAGVQVDFEQATDAAAAVMTGADGSFRLAGVKPGATVALKLQKAAYIAAEKPTAVIPATGDLSGLLLHMIAAPRVVGTVQTHGAPLGDAAVQVSILGGREQDWQEEFRWANTPRQAIAADGTYDVALPATTGQFAVRVVATGRTVATSPAVAITAGQDQYRVDLEIEGGGALAGRVVAMVGGEPVRGARVRAMWLAPGVDADQMMRGPNPEPVVAVGDGDGRFSVTSLRSGRCELRVSADGFLEEKVEVRVPQTGELVVSLPPELTLEGHIVYRDGQPVAAAQVSPEPQQGNRLMWTSIEQVTMSAPDGRFKIPRLHPGQYRISVHPPRTGVSNFRPSRSSIVAAGAHDVRIVVEPGASISGRVTDADQRGLPRVSVGAQISGGGGGIGVETLQDGTFTLIGLEDGATYTVSVNVDNWGGRNPFASMQRPNVAAGTTGLEFVLQQGLAVDGVVVDGDGKPTAGVEVTAVAVGTDLGYGPVAWTDQDGKFAIRGLRAGHYRLAIPQWFSRGLLLTGGDDVAAGTSDLRLTATEGAKIAGIIVDEADAPVGSAEVEAEAMQAGVQGGSWTRSQADGRFQISGLVANASYRVAARLRGRVPATQSATAGSTDLRLQLVLGLGVRGRLLDASGNALADTNLSLVNATTSRAVGSRTDAEGRFAATGLVAGTYRVEVWTGAANHLVKQDCGTVEAGQEDVELRLRQ